jgi:hypothetical protein
LERKRPATVLVGRFGSFLLSSPEGFKPPHRSTLNAIASSLEKDSRVVDVRRPDGIEDNWCGQSTIFPAPADDEGVVSAHDALKSLYFNRPLEFSVRVPEKNQPKKREEDIVPTTYRAFWDGILMLVTWRMPSQREIPLSGGHIVSEILSAAVKRLHLSLYVQGCNPVCSHEFAHTDIRFLPAKDRTRPEYVDCKQFEKEVHAHTPPMSDEELGTYVFFDLRITARRFTRLKNYGRRILETEEDGRQTLETLMQLNYARGKLPTLPLKERIESRWKMRGWLRQARLLIARIWIILANIEALRREWDRFRLDFESGAQEYGRERLFALDYADEVDRVRSLNLELMRSGVQELAERIDSRALLRVTAVAAIAGAVAGGVVGGIAANAF